MRLIPGKTKVSLELFKGVRIADMIIGGISLGILVFIVTSNLPGKFIAAIVFVAIVALLLMRMDGEPNYNYVLHIIRHFGYKREYKSDAATGDKKIGKVSEITAFTDIKEGYIEFGGAYYGKAIEIPPVEFRFFSQGRRNNAIENGLGRVLRSMNSEYAANIVKIERPIIYDHYIDNENKKLETLKKSFEAGFLTEEEMKARVEIIYDRIDKLQLICFKEKVVEPFYYLVIYDSDKKQLANTVANALDSLSSGEMMPRCLDDKETAIFLKYTNEIDFDEREIDDIAPENYAEWARPKTIKITAKNVEVNNMVTHNFKIVNYPSVVGDAWMAGLMSIPATKVVIKAKPMDRAKAMRRIDLSLQELRGRLASTGIDSKVIELTNHIDTLSELLNLLQGDNEMLLETNVYVTAYDSVITANTPSIYPKPENSLRTNITNMKKVMRRMYSEAGFRLNNNEFSQMEAFIGSQVSAYDPMAVDGRGIPSNSLAASFPWIYSHVADKNGVDIGTSDGVPVFVDFFRRDSERVNSNMVIVGKSGSGKSFSTKSILSNLAADDSKIFVLDPENEYTELANNLHGKFINVGNAQHGRLNPFHIITTLDDDENTSESGSDSYSTHLQFLEEFFRQILPDCEKDALEYLNSLIDRMYLNAGITPETDLSKLKPTDYPIFDNLYDVILEEFQSTDSDYIRSMLRVLMNYTSKFSSGGRNATIWNGPSTVTTDENFTVFNFQSLLSNRNGVIANAQMLLVLKYIDNEIIKNREYNKKYGLNRKVIVVIDEAHVFIDTKYPVALDFMFQLAKRIRKYNGMQIVITQNIKDFVGSEEIARKSTAIINACQYSFIFSLAPNDMDDLCKLYEKAGGINENEQEQIVSAQRGNAFTVLSPQSRSQIKIEVPKNIEHIFSDTHFESERFSGVEGKRAWEKFVGESRNVRKQNIDDNKSDDVNGSDEDDSKKVSSAVTFVEMGKDDIAEMDAEDKSDKKSVSAPVRSKNSVKSTVKAENTQLESVVEKLSQLTDNIGRLSYDALLGEMRRIIRQENGLEPVPETVPVRQAVPEIVPEVPEAEVDIAELTANLDKMEDLELSAAGPVPGFMGTSYEGSFELAEEEPDVEDDDDFINELRATLKDDIEIDNTDYDNEDTDVEEYDADEEDAEDTDVEEYDDDEEDDETSGSENDEQESMEFDIMGFLAEEAEKLQGMSAIDMMETYGETVITVSIEELTKYNASKRK